MGATLDPARRLPPPPLGPDSLAELHRFMLLTRLVEDKLAALYRQGRLTGGLYSSLGQEAISVGSAFALGAEDVFAPMIRNLGAVLVRGISLDEVFLNYLARGAGPTRGKDNVVHFGTVDGQGHFIIDHRGGMVSPISQLGPLISVLAGMALAARLQGRPIVTLTYSGDGATATGEFHEGMCFAAAQHVPLVVFIENNGFAYSTPTVKEAAVTRLAVKAKAYGIPAATVDGNDAEAVYTVTREAVERARAGGGPTLIEAVTFRMKGHAQHDDQHYVAKEVLEEWAKKDPIARAEAGLRAHGVLDDAKLAELRAGLVAAVDEAADRALAAPPPLSETVLDDVFAI